MGPNLNEQLIVDVEAMEGCRYQMSSRGMDGQRRKSTGTSGKRAKKTLLSIRIGMKYYAQKISNVSMIKGNGLNFDRSDFFQVCSTYTERETLSLQGLSTNVHLLTRLRRVMFFQFHYLLKVVCGTIYRTGIKLETEKQFAETDGAVQYLLCIMLCYIGTVIDISDRDG